MTEESTDDKVGTLEQAGGFLPEFQQTIGGCPGRRPGGCQRAFLHGYGRVFEDNGGEGRMSGVIGTVIGMTLGFVAGFAVGFALGLDTEDNDD